MANIVELRDMSDEELRQQLEDNREELFNLRFKKAQGSLEDTASLKRIRREIAQLNEVLGKRTWAINEATKQSDIADALVDKIWSASTSFIYEEGVWVVRFVDENENELAQARVDLNKKRRRTRRQRTNIDPVQKVVGVEVAQS